MLDEVLKFATKAHGDQKRKYTGDPYIVHPIAVAEIVKTVPHTDAMHGSAMQVHSEEAMRVSNTHGYQ